MYILVSICSEFVFLVSDINFVAECISNKISLPRSLLQGSFVKHWLMQQYFPMSFQHYASILTFAGALRSAYRATDYLHTSTVALPCNISQLEHWWTPAYISLLGEEFPKIMSMFWLVLWFPLLSLYKASAHSAGGSPWEGLFIVIPWSDWIISTE